MNSRSRAVVASTVGYMCLAIGGWMASMTGAGWYSAQTSTAILLPLAIVLLAIGILSFVADRGLDAVVFFGGAGVFGSAAVYTAMLGTQRITMSLSYMGWFACMWAIYFLCVSVGSMRSGRARMGFLVGTWVALGCLAIAGWAASPGWEIAAGYVGLITSLLAFSAAGAEIVGLGRMANPNLEMPRTARPMAAD
jgi:succinate-acetate transporter protein